MNRIVILRLVVVIGMGRFISAGTLIYCTAWKCAALLELVLRKSEGVGHCKFVTAQVAPLDCEHTC